MLEILSECQQAGGSSDPKQPIRIDRYAPYFIVEFFGVVDDKISRRDEFSFCIVNGKVADSSTVGGYPKTIMMIQTERKDIIVY
jgi:hypothetical protein